MRKTYGMMGVSESVLRLPVGKTTVIATFTDGNLQSRVPTPATCTTENIIAQVAIESCEMFANKKIFLISVSGEESEVESVVEPEVEDKTATTPKKTKTTKTDTKKTRVMADVKTFGDAVTALMTENEVSASDLVDVASVVRKAAELGISFPNLK